MWGQVRYQGSHLHPCWTPAPRLIQGFILRHAPRCPENAFFVDHVRTSFLLNLRRQLPRNILDTSWPTPPPALREVRGHSLLTGGPPTHPVEGPNNHVTQGAMGREGTWSWAAESELSAEKQFRNGRVVPVEGVSLRPRSDGGHMPVVCRGKGARLPGCPDLRLAHRPQSCCGSCAGRTWCGNTAGASAPNGSSRYGAGRQVPGDWGAGGGCGAGRELAWRTFALTYRATLN